MSPIKRKKLSKIRFELDKLDNNLIKLIKKRTNLVKKVLKLKDKKNQIVDQKRIKFILKNLNRYFFSQIVGVIFSSMEYKAYWRQLVINSSIN